jgi:hypothetical protein
MRMKPLMVIVLAAAGLSACGGGAKGPVIYVAEDASRLERFCASEMRRYLYLATGGLSSIKAVASVAQLGRPGIILDRKGRLLGERVELEVPAVPDAYRLKTVTLGRRKHVAVAAGDGPGILYGTYAFVRKLGVRFDLDGDVVPDERISFVPPDIDETGTPLFARRGIQPFHDFPEGPDWWDEDVYKAVLGQLPKLGMNTFGLHTYPEKNPNAEPTVWIGPPGGYGPDGAVTESYPSSWMNTLRENKGSHNWGFRPEMTGDFRFGAAELFESDAFGPGVMAGLMPEPADDAGSNALFNRAAEMLKRAFGFAHELGVRTVVGTETPLTIPAAVRERLVKAGKNPTDPAVVKELYKGIFGRIAAAYPVDLYWLWTTESWTWSDADPAAVRAVASDLAQAEAALLESGAPFGLATCGWVLGPPSRRTLFDEILPKSVTVSCINREVGKAPVDPGFAAIEGRSKWAIPWLEDDPSLTSPQLWAGRMRRDAVDAKAYGCDGLLGIHWRTRILSPNIRALAAAAWDQGWAAAAGAGDPAGPINGRYAAVKNVSAGGGADAAVYADVRDRVSGYRLLVPDGTYAVTVKMCEGEFDRPGARVFDIFIQGVKAAEKVDVFARAGGRGRPFDLVFPGIAVEDGTLRLDFGDRIHYPAVAGLAADGRTVEGRRYVVKINCGGPEAGDYAADWPETARSLDASDLYLDWARNMFGPAAAREIAAIFSRLDGKLPIPVTWTNGPGGIVPDGRPWSEVEPAYAFVGELAALRPRIRGAGSFERFDYWLRSFEYMREIARYRCLWGEYSALAEKAAAETDPARKRETAEKELLPARIRMIASLRKIMGNLLASAGTTGGLGTIANWEQHNVPVSIEKPGEELAAMLGGPLPPEAELPRAYEGPGRIIVPAARTAIAAGEDLILKIIVLSATPVEEAVLEWRKLGRGKYRRIPLENVGRSVYRAVLPAPASDIEYFLRARSREGEWKFPATAPAIPQTVVIF